MFGLGVTMPWPMRSRMRPETVGCAEPKWWSGLGRPYFSGRPAWAMTMRSMTRWRIGHGMRGSFLSTWSIGRPKTYLGRIHAPRRAAR